MKSFKCFIIFFCFLGACSSQDHKPLNKGVVKVTFDTFLDNAFPALSASSLIWYSDSAVIMEIPTIRFESKNGEPAIRNDTIMHYLFIDLKTMSFYQYGTFTDTATLQKSYWQPDSLYIDGGWNFYYAKKVVMLDKPESLSDTAINSILYKRVKFSTAEKQSRGSYAIGYIRCDRGRSVFSCEQLYSDSINCIMDKIESYNTITNKKETATGTKFLRDSLNKDELKVFYTWERYAKKHPPTEKKLK